MSQLVPITARIEQIRALTTTQKLLLQGIDDADQRERYAGALMFNSLVFLNSEIGKELEFLEVAIRALEEGCSITK